MIKARIIFLPVLIFVASITFARGPVIDTYGISWYVDLDSAIQAAEREDKPIFLFAGYDTDEACEYIRRAALPSDTFPNRQLLEDYYIALRLDLGSSSDHQPYISGLTFRGFPYIAVLPRNAYDTYAYRDSGGMDGKYIHGFLDEYKYAEADLSHIRYRDFTWFMDFEQGMAEARSSRRPVLLYVGRPSDPSTGSIISSVLGSWEDPDVKSLIIDDFVMIQLNPDTQGAFWKYAPNTSISLPFIAVISQADASDADAVFQGYIPIADFHKAIISTLDKR